MTEPLPEFSPPVGRHVAADRVDEWELAGPDAEVPGEWVPSTGSPVSEQRKRLLWRPWPLGLIAMVLTVLVIVAQIVAVSLMTSGQFGPATVLAEILAFATVLPLVVGVLAIIRNRWRSWGIVAVVVSIMTNPLVLIAVLDFFGSF